MGKSKTPRGQESAGLSLGGDGTVYLLHLDPPLKHARHYTGWTHDLDQRMEAHRSGRGARLMEVIKEAGGTFRLVRTWPGSRALERAIKDQKNAPQLCPECTSQPRPLVRRLPAAPQATGRDTSVPSQDPERQAAPASATVAEIVPEPGTDAWLRWSGREPSVDPASYDELVPIIDRLEAGWRREADLGALAPEPEAGDELEVG